MRRHAALVWSAPGASAWPSYLECLHSADAPPLMPPCHRCPGHTACHRYSAASGPPHYRTSGSWNRQQPGLIRAYSPSRESRDHGDSDWRARPLESTSNLRPAFTGAPRFPPFPAPGRAHRRLCSRCRACRSVRRSPPGSSNEGRRGTRLLRSSRFAVCIGELKVRVRVVGIQLERFVQEIDRFIVLAEFRGYRT